MLDEAPSFDFATALVRDTVDGLLDGNGSVALLDFQPCIVPNGYTLEYMIVRAARTSLGTGLKNHKLDTWFVELYLH